MGRWSELCGVLREEYAIKFLARMLDIFTSSSNNSDKSLLRCLDFFTSIDYLLIKWVTWGERTSEVIGGLIVPSRDFERFLR